MSFRLSLLGGAAALVLLCGAGLTPDADRDAWLADYFTLKQALETQYANLTWFASPQGERDLPALDRRTTTALQKATTTTEARVALLAFQAAFRDGHFVGRASPEPSPDEAVEPEWPDLKSSNPAAAACVALGYGGAASPFSLPIETLPTFQLLTDGDAQPFRSGVVVSGFKQIGVIRIPSFAMENYPALCRQNWSAEGVDDGGDVNQSALERAISRAWYAELAGILHTFQSRGVDAVVVDIGGNGGGDDSGDMGTRLFTNRIVRSSPLLIKRGPAAEGYLHEQIEQLEYGLTLGPAPTGAALLSQVRDDLRRLDPVRRPADCDLSWVWQEQRTWDPSGGCDLVPVGSAGGPLAELDREVIPQTRIARRLSWAMNVKDLWGSWSGPVYVLIDGRTGSSAEMFAATLQNNLVAKVAGVESSGAGCGAMGPDGRVTLPGVGLTFSLPTCVRLRPDGSDEVAGIRPDLPIRPTAGESRRARAARVFTAIASDLSRPISTE